MIKIYIAGAISGVENYEKDFNQTENKLKQILKVIVFNPAILPQGWSYKDYLKVTMAMLKRCDVIFLLDSWKNSNGAKKELAYALSVNMPIFTKIEDLEKYIKSKLHR